MKKGNRKATAKQLGLEFTEHLRKERDNLLFKLDLATALARANADALTSVTRDFHKKGSELQEVREQLRHVTVMREGAVADAKRAEAVAASLRSRLEAIGILATAGAK
jgi:hypothetical protein